MNGFSLSFSGNWSYRNSYIWNGVNDSFGWPLVVSLFLSAFRRSTEPLMVWWMLGPQVALIRENIFRPTSVLWFALNSIPPLTDSIERHNVNAGRIGKIPSSHYHCLCHHIRGINRKKEFAMIYAPPVHRLECWSLMWLQQWLLLQSVHIFATMYSLESISNTLPLVSVLLDIFWVSPWPESMGFVFIFFVPFRIRSVFRNSAYCGHWYLCILSIHGFWIEHLWSEISTLSPSEYSMDSMWSSTFHIVVNRWGLDLYCNAPGVLLLRLLTVEMMTSIFMHFIFNHVLCILFSESVSFRLFRKCDLRALTLYCCHWPDELDIWPFVRCILYCNSSFVCADWSFYFTGWSQIRWLILEPPSNLKSES